MVFKRYGVRGNVLLHAVFPGLVGVSLGLVDGGALARSDRGRWSVGLARGPVEGHHPVMRVLLVFSGKEHTVPLPHCVEEKLSAFQIYKERSQSSNEGNDFL